MDSKCYSPEASPSFSSSAASSSFSSSSDIDHVIETKPPWVHETKSANRSPAHGSPARAPPQIRSNNQESPRVDQNSPEKLHPIVRVFQQQELGRHLLVLAIPMIIALLTFSFCSHENPPIRLLIISLALALGVAAIWVGILLRETCPSFSVWMEFLGVALMLLVFYGFVAWFIPTTLLWFPIICWLLTVLPFAIVFRFTMRALKNGPPPHRTSKSSLV